MNNKDNQALDLPSLQAKTYQRPSCEGHIYLTINRDDAGKFVSLMLSPPAKTNNCGGAFAYALQDLLTFALRRIKEKDDITLILKAVRGQKCNAMPPNRHHCRSCVDALYGVLKSEFNKEEMSEVHDAVV